MSIKIEGLDAIVKKLDNMVGEQKISMAVGQACAIVEKAAKEKAPKDTGALRRSITSKVETEKNNVVGTVYTPLEYAPYIEYGTGLFAEDTGRKDVPWRYQDDKGNWHTTSGMHPRPFLRPALNENRDKIIKKIREGIKND